MQNGQNHTVRRRVQELVGMPARGQGPGFSLAITDDAGDDQVGIIVGGAVCVRDSVPEFSALVYRAGRLGRHVTRNAARERKLREEPLQALLVLGDVWVDLAV